jgi:hypothetical protein
MRERERERESVCVCVSPSHIYFSNWPHLLCALTIFLDTISSRRIYLTFVTFKQLIQTLLTFVHLKEGRH